MSAPAPKPFSLQAPERIAMEYGGNKQKIAQAVQSGLVDPTAGLLAGMFIDRMRAAQVQEQAPNQTVAQQVLGPQGPQGGPPPPGGPPPQGAPQGGPPPGGPPPPPPPQGGPPPQGPVGMAEGGLTSLPVPDYMFDEQTFAGGGIVAFRTGDAVEGGGFFNQVRNRDFTGRNKELTEDELRILREKIRAGRLPKNSSDGVNLLAALNKPYEGPRGFDLAASMLPDFTSRNDDSLIEPTMVAPVVPPPPAAAPAAAPAVAPAAPVVRAPAVAPAAPIVRAPRTNIADIIRSAAAAKSIPTPTARPDLPTDAAATPAAKEETREELQARIKTMMGDVPVPKGTSAEDKAARKKEDLYSALMQAGFSMMAGTSQNALTNIGEGFKAAIPTMQASLKERRADEKEERAQQYSYELAKYGVNKDAAVAAVSEFRDLSKQKQEERLAELQRKTQLDISKGNNAASLAAARIAASNQSVGEQAVAAYYNRALADATTAGTPITPQLKARLLAEANEKNTTLNTGMRNQQANANTRAAVIRAIQAQVVKNALQGYPRAKKLDPKLTMKDWQASEVERLKGDYGTLFTEDFRGTEPPAGFVEQN